MLVYFLVESYQNFLLKDNITCYVNLFNGISCEICGSWWHAVAWMLSAPCFSVSDDTASVTKADVNEGKQVMGTDP